MRFTHQGPSRSQLAVLTARMNAYAQPEQVLAQARVWMGRREFALCRSYVGVACALIAGVCLLRCSLGLVALSHGLPLSAVCAAVLGVLIWVDVGVWAHVLRHRVVGGSVVLVSDCRHRAVEDGFRHCSDAVHAAWLRAVNRGDSREAVRVPEDRPNTKAVRTHQPEIDLTCAAIQLKRDTGKNQ